VLLLNAGNLLFRREYLSPDRVPPSRLIADLILDAYRVMGCDALGIGAYDLSLGVSYLLERREKSPFPFLCANLVDRQGKRLFAPYVIKEVGGLRVGVFGLLGDDLKKDKVPGGDTLEVKDPLETGRRIVAELQGRGVDLIVLLTDMLSRSSRRLATELPIHVVVGSDQRNQVSIPITVQETMLIHLDRGGRSIGRLEVARAQDAGAGTRGDKVGGFFLRNSFVQLRVEMPDHPAVGPRVAQVLQELSKVQEEVAASVQAAAGDPDCGKEFVGIGACRECHAERYRGWLETPHAKAYQSLVAKGRQFDGECVVCHAVAFECDKEVIDWKALEGFLNVQCEACHGPGSLHAASKGGQGLTLGPGLRAACLRCHTPERSAEFDFPSWSLRVCTPDD